jgi:ribulose-phosphate 3-epimerase
MDAQINPSILSADFVNFERDFATISAADAIHVDVMDGHFVPNLTFGLPVVKRMREIARLPLDVHLMIENVDSLAVEYAKIGAQSVTFHHEASQNPVATARSIRAEGSLAALALKPGTPASVVLDHIEEFDMLLVMTVEPGFGGQAFMATMLPKVEELAQAIKASGRAIRLQVDGGVDLSNIAATAACGADTFVAGSSVFSAPERNQRINELRSIAQEILAV